MSKWNQSRLLETARILATDVGKQIPDFFEYMADFVENTTRILRGGISFSDNFACDVRTGTLLTGVAQVVNATRTVTGIIPLKVVSITSGIDSFSWYYDSSGRLTVKIDFTGTPTAPLDTLLVLLY